MMTLLLEKKSWFTSLSKLSVMLFSGITADFGRCAVEIGQPVPPVCRQSRWSASSSKRRFSSASTPFCVIFTQLSQFFTSVKSFLFIRLTLKLTNFKIKIIIRNVVFYPFADKLIINLFVVRGIKIIRLKIRIVCFCTKSTWSVFVCIRTILSQTDLIISIG